MIIRQAQASLHRSWQASSDWEILIQVFAQKYRLKLKTELSMGIARCYTLVRAKT